MLRGLFDFHIGENISAIHLDLPRYFDQLQAAGVGSLTFMTKDAMGVSYYDTKVGRRNRHLPEDILARAVELAHERGLRLVAYYNTSLNDYLDVEHPDWRQVDAQGESPYVFRQYTAMCMNSPYRDLVRTQIEEIVGGYAVAGLWLDITYIFDGRCYCERCRQLYRERHGQPMPVSTEPGSRERAQLQQFRRDCRREFIADFVETARGLRGPDFSVGWNHAGDIKACQVEVDRLASQSSNEFHAPAYQEAFLNANWTRAFGKPFELMASECLYGWGEWTVAPQATLRAMSAIALATGGDLNLGHVPIPSGPGAGALAEPVAESFASLWRWLGPRQAACEGAANVPGAAVLNPAANQRLKSTYGERWIDDPPDGVMGAHRALLELHWPVDVVCEETLGDLSRYEIVLLPEILHVSDGVAAALGDYVQRGGVLIVEGETGTQASDSARLPDSVLAELTGVRLTRSSGLTVRYFDGLSPSLAAGLPDMPILVRSEREMLNPVLDKDCEILSTFTDPEYEARPRRHIYHQHGHPAVETDTPAVTQRQLGEGRVVYVAAPLSADYRRHGHPWQRILLGNLIDLCTPNRLLRVEGPPSLRVAAMRAEDHLIVHLLYWHQVSSTGPAFVEDEPPLTGARLSVRSGSPSRVVQIDDDTRELDHRYDGRRVEVEARPFRVHAMVVIEA